MYFKRSTCSPSLRGGELGHQHHSVKEIFRDGRDPVRDNRVNYGYTASAIRSLLMALLICLKFCYTGFAAVLRPNMDGLI